ncbi:hypothetical protein PI23P_03277 [Polaribacter irgensii 23-P]|uniref:Uncharacterized protein n=1 Tax=Polaribacter irgensii 23-P TaxID=313594 RepID=A4BWZ2_9FLAO|nr:hypothetical protein [Polaribacter irgensii]EAR13483.1 hypothetical protein PI23P_03277 [Polaribacter irgensii 23-P]
MKKKVLSIFATIIGICVFYVKFQTEENQSFIITPEGKLKLKLKPNNASQLYAIEREKFELNMQKNPIKGEVLSQE